jgi:hypothetical protein
MTTTTKVTSTTFQDLDVCIGVRVRLSKETKDLIKKTFDAMSMGEVKTPDHVFGSIQVSHAPNTNPALEKAMGCNRIVLSSLLGSNERHPVSMLMNWERTLGITIIDRKEIQAAWKSYFDSNLK